MRQPRPRTVLIGAGAALALVAGSTAAYAAINSPISNGVIHGCYYPATGGSHKVVLQDVGTRCPSGTTPIKWNQTGPQGLQGLQGVPGQPGATGPQGPSGIVSMVPFNPGSTPHTGADFAFTGVPPVVTFTDSHTIAEVTVTVGQASADGNFAGGVLGVCYEPVGGGAVTADSAVVPQFQAPAFSYFTQTVSGLVGGLTPGQYFVGMCQAQDTANLVDGPGTGTIIVGETASGASSAGPRHGVSPAQLRPARPVRTARQP